MRTSSPASFLSCSRPDVVARIRDQYGNLGGWPVADKLPVVYSQVYNIGFLGLENLHPFDSKKYQRVVSLLEAGGYLTSGQLMTAREAPHDMLLDVHDAAYLQAINTSSLKVAQVTELAPLALMPACLLRSKVLKPMRFMAGGTMLAAALAQERGWAVNLGGGMHHAWHGDGGGWCVYDDAYLALRRLRQASGGLVSRCMVIDLDVHQGNGIERDKLHFEDGDTFIVDVFNGGIYPLDTAAKKAIDVKVELESGTGDSEYLAAVQRALQEAFELFPRPDLVIYNAVMERDEAVWRAACQAGAPIVMLLSGGYSMASTPCIAQSLGNLFDKFGLGGGAAAGGAAAGGAAASEL